MDALGDVSQHTVLEIGPGRGILTSLLAKRARRLIAVELDRVLAAQFRLKFGMFRNVEVIEADVLTIDFESLFGPKPGLGRPGIEVQAGTGESGWESALLHYLGYFAAAVCVLEILRQHRDYGAEGSGGPDCGRAGWQRLRNPVGDRAVKCAGGESFLVPPGEFAPPPKVHSSLLRLTIDPQQEKLGVAGDGFIDFLRLSFGQKRKTLWNNLKENYEAASLKRALAEAKVKPTARAETLSLEESAAVYRALRNTQSES